MNFIHNVVDAITGHHDPAAPSTIVKIKGTVVLMKNNVLDFNDFSASILDRVHELLGDGVSLQLVSATVGDPNLGGRGKVGKAANLEHWIATLTSINAGESNYGVTFEWDTAMGVPGAVIVKNHHHSEFFLKSFTLEDVPGPKSRLFFACNSWVYPTDKYTYDRVFFVNDTYKAEETPLPLKSYREEELFHLRGDNVPGPLQIWDRVYGYAFYNDLGDPDNGEEYVRPILGGSQDLPYPRRARSSRPPSKTDPNTESRLPLLSQLNFYVPRDERFGHLKQSDFLGYFLKNLSQGLMPALNSVFDSTPDEFDSFEDTYSLYEGGPKRPEGVLGKVRDLVPFEMLKELLRTDGERILKLPTPQVIQADKEAWRTDDEYGRETVAGVNPVMITLLTDFPVKSKLDPAVYGNQHSSVCAADLEKNLGGLTVAQAIAKKKLFIVDHHDSLLPFLPRVNTIHKIYASRLFLFLRDDSTLKPIAIELSLPHPDGLNCGAVNQVYTPAHEGVEGSIWLLAKAYAAVNDSGVHQLICHWLNTHAVIEPIVIATHRQLSVLHPIHKLLYPHYKDTLSINALGRQVLINAGGGMEKTVFPDRYAMEMSSAVYKSWKLTEQGLPADLLKRGVAVEDPSAPYGLRLLIEDYPYANDGLAVYHAIQDWVQEYVSIFYPSDAAVKGDGELQAWWKEIREVGHGDKKDEAWWLKMDSCSDLTHTCTTLIWVTSALHAAVNFGQYPYAGYMPNRPTISRKFMPEPGTADYEELVKDPERAYLRTITSQFLTIVGVSLIETLSKHASDEVFLGQRATTEWTSNEKALEVFNKFGQKLVDIEKRIEELNQDEKLKNRNGPVKVPYTLLYPNTSDTSGKGGLLGKGIPNSISI